MRFFAIAAACLMLLAYNYRGDGTASQSAAGDHLYYYPKTSMIADTLSPSLQLAAFQDRQESRETPTAAMKYRVEHTAAEVGRHQFPEPATDARLPALVQEELRRLGCYSGKIDNRWGRKSRDALARFSKTAAVQHETPSMQALAFLRNANGTCSQTACGKSCPKQIAVAPASVATDARPSYLPPPGQAAAKGDLEPTPLSTTPRKRRQKARASNTRKVVKASSQRRTVAAGHKSFGWSWPGNY